MDQDQSNFSPLNNGGGQPEFTPPPTPNVGNEFITRPQPFAPAQPSQVPITDQPQQPQPIQPSASNPFTQPVQQNIGVVAAPTQFEQITPQPTVSQPNIPMPSQPLVPGQPVVGSFQPAGSTQQMQPVQFGNQAATRSKKKLIGMTAGVLAGLILLGGGAAAYMGIIGPNKPENLWHSALVNTGKGYDKLVTFADKSQDVKDWSQKGNFKLSGTVAADGTITGKSSGDTSQFTTDVSAAGVKLNFDIRTFPSANSTPDFYIKANGLQGIGTLFAPNNPSMQTALNSINNQWYVIDHSLFDQMGVSANTQTQINGDDVVTLFKSFGASSKKYIFTKDANNAAVVMKEKVGKEKRDGRNVYHYKVGVKKDQLQKYMEALCNDVKTSKLGKGFGTSLTSYDCKQQAKSADEIKESDTADAWVDTKTRLIHSIRFTNAKNKDSYTEISQNYTGGDVMPFKVLFHDKQSDSTADFVLDMNYDSKKQSFAFKGTLDSQYKNADDNETGTFALTIQPTQGKVTIEKPTDAKTILQLMSDIGFGDSLASPSELPSTIDSQSDTGLQTKANTNNSAILSRAVLSALHKQYTDL